MADRQDQTRRGQDAQGRREWGASEPLRAGDVLAEGEVQPIEEAEVLRQEREEGSGERPFEEGGAAVGGVAVGGAAGDRVHDLERQLASAHQEMHRAQREADTLREELKGARDQAARAMADLDNWRKRYSRDMDREVLEQRKSVVLTLLPVVDNLERALASASGQAAGVPAADALLKGVDMVLSMARDALRRLGVTKIEARDAPFDPTYHEAMGTRGDDPATAGHVVDIIENGYLIGQDVLRPARVMVGGTRTEMATSTAQTPYEGP